MANPEPPQAATNGDVGFDFCHLCIFLFFVFNRSDIADYLKTHFLPLSPLPAGATGSDDDVASRGARVSCATDWVGFLRSAGGGRPRCAGGQGQVGSDRRAFVVCWCEIDRVMPCSLLSASKGQSEQWLLPRPLPLSCSRLLLPWPV